MASRKWANFGGSKRKIYKDIEREPNFFGKPSTFLYTHNEKSSVHINAYNCYSAPGAYCSEGDYGDAHCSSLPFASEGDY